MFTPPEDWNLNPDLLGSLGDSLDPAAAPVEDAPAYPPPDWFGGAPPIEEQPAAPLPELTPAEAAPFEAPLEEAAPVEAVEPAAPYLMGMPGAPTQEDIELEQNPVGVASVEDGGLVAPVEAEAPVQLDAISGGALPEAPQPELESAVPGDAQAPMSPEDEAAYNQAMTDQGVEADAEAELADLQGMTGPQRAAYEARREVLRKQRQEREYLGALVHDRELIEKQQKDVEEIFRQAKERTEGIREKAIALSQRTPDTKRWFRDLPTASKVSFALSGLLDGIFDADNPNETIEYLTGEQEKDIQRQRDDIANGWKGLEVEQGLVRDFVRDGMDLHTASNAARITMMANTRDQILARAALYDPAGTLAQEMFKAAAHSQGLIDKALRDFELEERKYGLEQYQAQTSRSTANRGWAELKYKKQRDQEEDQMQREGWAVELTKEQMKIDADKSKVAAEKQEQRGARAMVDPATGEVVGHTRFPSPEAAREDQNAMNGYRNARRSLLEYAKLHEKIGRTYQGPGGESRFLKSQDKQDMDAAYKRLTSAIAMAQSGKAASDAERKVVEEYIPPPGGWTTRADPAETTRQIMGYLDTEHEGFMRSRLEPGSEGSLKSYMGRVRSLDYNAPAAETEVGKLSKEVQKPVEDRAWWVLDRGGKNKWEEMRAAEMAGLELASMAKKGDADAAEALWNAYEAGGDGKSASISALYSITGTNHPEDLEAEFKKKEKGQWNLKESLENSEYVHDVYGNPYYRKKGANDGGYQFGDPSWKGPPKMSGSR